MAIEKVKAYFDQFGMKDRILEFDVSSATVELAAQAAGCEPARIAKTLSFLVEDGCVLIVTAGDGKVNNGKFKKVFQTKAKMLRADQVEPMTGHQIGGVCPFGIHEGVRVYLDESLKRFDSVFPACGSSNSAIELTLEELEKYSGSLGWIDVCNGWQEVRE
ncbi:MAG: YbaK/EbsC family protein [Blautia sp.]|jgi:prolyl-tRNA editing enzyme YbaK/EbsC (Cys-tRNA(Pro) deacylase)